MSSYAQQLALEQSVINASYQRLDNLREQTKQRLAKVRATRSTSSPTQQAERDAFATMYENRLIQLRSVEDRLVFGKLQLDTQEELYIGRIGLSDDEHKAMLTDWRAEAARPFYEATPNNAMNVAMRRHITLNLRNVVALEDEILNNTSDHVQNAFESGTLTGEGALLASLSSRRTGKMTDIVATIQAEQDRIIREDLGRVIVVQGGPGTGKTAVALHRAAYLLYTHRNKLAHSGVLIIGPSSTFLHYIDQVLPSLGETGVVSKTIEKLLPNINAQQSDDPFVAKIKGDATMTTAITNAVKAYVRVPQILPTVPINGVRIAIREEDIRAAQKDALHARVTHNRGRELFVKRMITLLLEQYLEQLDYTPNRTEIDVARNLIQSSSQVKKTLNLAWLPLTAQWTLEQLLAKPHKLRAAAPWLSDEELQALYRPKNSPLTRSDVPLLDEIMEKIGDEPLSSHAPQQQTSEDEQYAQDTLESFGVSSKLVDVRMLAETMNGPADDDDLVTRATKDRTWTYGHIVVDEAQELTPMEWKMLIRRCPSRSFTIVGDVAQTATLGGARSWETMLNPLFGKNRWHLHELTIDYRNPRSVAELATQFATQEGLYVSTVQSVREVPDALSIRTMTSFDNAVELACRAISDYAVTYLHSDGSGRIACMGTQDYINAIRKKIWNVLAETLPSEDVERLQHQQIWDQQITLCTPHETKGLEYDAVVIVDPESILSNAPHRLVAASDLYVALTRPTQQLCLVQKCQEYGQFR